MTNFEKIKAMSVEEMADLISTTNDGDLIVDICASAYCEEYSEETVKCSGNCRNAIIKYLESEADTE